MPNWGGATFGDVILGCRECNGVGKSGSKADLLKKVKAFGYYVKAAAPMTGIALSVIISDSAIAVIPNEVAQLYLQEKVDKLDYLFFLYKTWFNSIGKKEEKAPTTALERHATVQTMTPPKSIGIFTATHVAR